MKRRKKGRGKEKGIDTGKGKEKGASKGEGPRGKIETEIAKGIRTGLPFKERFEPSIPNQTFSSFTSFSD
ncbi:hypothetical protein [Sunxiuqinia elliptica]|uniref:hypothetical protein n=1 Tax=Sunxiuqinia elliptica TaxID=655355 RepID=UPI00105CAB9D|nr:hypothetical protein [Sunxiuqinia elliptica]